MADLGNEGGIAETIALLSAVEGQRGGHATFVSVESVGERQNGQPVWQGEVHVSHLDWHPTATQAYA